MRYRVDEFARHLPAKVTVSVRSASALKYEARLKALPLSFANSESARDQATEIKDFVLDNLKRMLIEFESNLIRNGVIIHWAETTAEANQIILNICQDHVGPDGLIVKGKSMVTEELHLNQRLEEAGLKPVETDLGEFVVQLDGDRPSHIVTPIIHKDRQEVGRTFAREGLGDYTEEPEALTLQARRHLRDLFRRAKVGISGVNFGVASSGRLVIVENEGNNRLSTTVPDVHIAVMGIEKLLPNESSLPLFLKLLAGSATGQQITTYTHFIKGPRTEDETDGPTQVHLVLLDAGRTQILSSPFRSVLRCIRCGACLNVCPVYRQASGLAYSHVYSGPIGAVLAPLLGGPTDLPYASSLCGACEAVCPVRIPLPDLLLQHRSKHGSAIPWGPFIKLATHSALWRFGLHFLSLAVVFPQPLKSSWLEFRDAPVPMGRDFRRWWRERA